MDGWPDEFVPASTVRDAEVYAIKLQFAHKVDYSGLSVEAANAFNESLYNHCRLIPELIGTIEKLGTTRRAAGLWSNRSIYLNRDYFSQKNLHAGLEALKKDVISGFHPPGCSTIKSVIDHEVGHHIDVLCR